jgi:hypothetical protein
VGVLVTLDLPADSPLCELPWIITIGPMHDDEEWEPVVCGPYERPHALALAESVVADEDLMAVVEPLLPLTDAEAIRDEIEQARSTLDADEAEAATIVGSDDENADPAADLDPGPGFDAEDGAEGGRRQARPSTPPTADEVRAGFARIAAVLTGTG